MVSILPTYIQGFDKELGGGIPFGHVVLISGSPGTMKSSLAFSIMHYGSKEKNLQGVYISLEQSRESLIFHMKRLGLSPIPKELEVVDLGRIRKNLSNEGEHKWLDILQNHITLLHSSKPFDLLAIDSLPVLEIIANIRQRRIQLFHFFEWLRDLGVTAFIINEVGPQMSALFDEEFLADGIIYLSMEKVGQIDVQRRIRCVKMRGMDHSSSYYTLEFKNKRFRVVQAI